MTLAQILKKIDSDLAWRSSVNGKTFDRILLSREEAEYLHRTVIAIIIERDQLVYEKEHRT